jgi:hypothetical protein
MEPMRRLLTLAAAAWLALGLAACHQEGPAEQAGQKLDTLGQKASDALNPPQGPAQGAGRKVDRALGQ